MKCPNCDSEVNRITFVYTNGTSVGMCKRCNSLTPMVDFKCTYTGVLNTGKTFTMSVAHKEDIKHRKVGEGGQVYRDTKKTYFS